MENCESGSESGSDFDFANLDLAGVNFDEPADSPSALRPEDTLALEIEKCFLTDDFLKKRIKPEEHLESTRLISVATLVASGKYVDALKSDSAIWLISGNDKERNHFRNKIRKMLSKLNSVSECVEAELIAIAAFNVFLQLNYTGPILDSEKDVLNDIDPHQYLSGAFFASQAKTAQQNESDIILNRRNYKNEVLTEMAVDGMWPSQVAHAPYFLLLARHIFTTLSDPGQGSWSKSQEENFDLPPSFYQHCDNLVAAPLWSARAAVAHERLLLCREPTITLWEETEAAFAKCSEIFKEESETLRSTILLEHGLACYHFDRSRESKDLFAKSKEVSGLSVEVGGAQGKRTKFQTKATAQMVVRAKSAKEDSKNTETNETVQDGKVKSQKIELDEDNILLEKVKFEDGHENEIEHLNVLDQAILMALCLDVKNSNPADGLTAEEMSAYLARILCHHDDWMVYSTALLERAWIDFEGVHTKERAILQMQALADQHSNRLTITQSTRKSVEESSPVQERLKNLHRIVYPPRWEMLRDVAERYASLGIVTTAAEIFTEIEYWDEVVDCYRRAGKENRAEEIVRNQLEISETPRMWCALGDISSDPSHYEKSIKLSNGRFAQAYISLGKYYFDKGDLVNAEKNYRQALKLRPLIPSVWFKVGTINMQLGNWELALASFSEVVQQNPDESDAWANVAAVHMHNKNPTEAYPALVESLKLNRSNWRVWASKLYTCLDLKKFDEATQACMKLMDFKATKSAQGIPDLEEKCVRAIVGGTIDRYAEAKNRNDAVAIDSAQRSLTRVHELLNRIRGTRNDSWVFEVAAYFHEQIGQDKQVFENLMQEYRSLSMVPAWEKDDEQVRRVCEVVTQIVHYQRGNKEELVKSKFLVSSVIKRVQKSRIDIGKIPKCFDKLQKLFEEILHEIQQLNTDV